MFAMLRNYTIQLLYIMKFHWKIELTSVLIVSGKTPHKATVPESNKPSVKHFKVNNISSKGSDKKVRQLKIKENQSVIKSTKKL